MKEDPFFSIIIPANRSSLTIKECVDCILQQTYKNFELILVTNHDQLSLPFDPRVRHLTSDSRHPNQKRNQAIRNAKGKWYVFTDDDTCPPSQWLENAYSTIEKNPEIKILAGSGTWPSDDWQTLILNKVLDSIWFQAKPHGLNLENKLKKIPFYKCSFYNVFLQSSQYHSILGTNEYANMYIDDTEFFYLLAKEVPIHFSPQILTYHKVRAPFDVFIAYQFNRRFMTGMNVWLFPEIFFSHLPVCLGILFCVCFWAIFLFLGLTPLFLLFSLGILFLYGQSLFLFSPRKQAKEFLLFPWIFFLSQCSSLLGFFLGFLYGWVFALFDSQHKRGKMLFKARKYLKREFISQKSLNHPILSIVSPIYDEDESLLELKENLISTVHQFEKENKKIECILVDDGSSKPVKLGDEKIKVFRLNKNLGKSSAILLGVFASHSSSIGIMDSDLQHDPMEFYKIYKKNHFSPKHIVGIRKKIHSENRYKRFLSTMGNKLINTILGFKATDFGSGFQFFPKKYSNFEFGRSSHRNFLVNSFINKYPIEGWALELKSRKYGRSKFGSSRIFLFLWDFFHNFIRAKISYNIRSKLYILYGLVPLVAIAFFCKIHLLLYFLLVLFFILSCYYNEKGKRGIQA